MFIVFDLDDTLTDTTHRRHILEAEHESEEAKWDAFFEACDKDIPNTVLCELFAILVSYDYNRIEIWTGRSEKVREKTEAWLKEHFPTSIHAGALRMRPDGDFREDTEIKGEWIEQHGSPALVFDDRNKMVEWWRDQGVTCCQVQNSDF